ncbi:MAG: MSMEG_4193 family putative phosphomutase [Anaerolineaceae bacterium]|nr:MSMEG_4193 family putative phosphomutase [Anaerolineaceae bacterium]
MATFLLIRHGDNDFLGSKLAGRLPGVHLNAKGQAQAQAVADGLAELPITAIYASPLERAQETAQPLAESKGLPIQVLPELMEIDFGEWQGQELAKLRKDKLWEIVQTNPATFRFPGGESFAEAQNRVVAGLLALSEQYGEKALIVCTSHSDIIRLAVAHFLALPLDRFQRIRIRPASVTVLHLNGGLGYFGPINYSFDFKSTLSF